MTQSILRLRIEVPDPLSYIFCGRHCHENLQSHSRKLLAFRLWRLVRALQILLGKGVQIDRESPKPSFLVPKEFCLNFRCFSPG